MRAKINAPITYYGGKKQMVPHILPLIPEHKVYVEPFFGGGAIFFAKEPAQLEIINDLNQSVMTFYQQIKHGFNDLSKMIAGSLHSREAYNQAKVIYELPGRSTIRSWRLTVP